MGFRILFFVVLLPVLVFLPWWVSVILVISGSFYFKNFYEAVVLGIIMDSIYGTEVVFNNFSYVFTISFLVLVFAINKLRQRLIMY